MTSVMPLKQIDSIHLNINKLIEKPKHVQKLITATKTNDKK